ncbi:hypothetical protein TPY_3746 [Sulfobacillus acidophilus TPY]|uniref:Uncharacterized protein n=1 Tax=Sulfobacillus acidophilus (strain ATCC 700253 / DSM 10332 / NAL) TaxID=679936 RepID=G8TUB7_SULAD|nr:hypothetical protein TPY_3746 [Sulfobacillus acidophilus TPY]AEW06879.1 hypothetical protein Sulac_3441 [Sulfobacillus acidophilus DSM 10332]
MWLWHASASLIWVMTGSLFIVKTPTTMPNLYRLQAVGEMLAVGALYVATRDPWLVLSLAILIGVKWFVVPGILTRSSAFARTTYGLSAPWGVSSLLIGDLVLTGLGIAVAHRLFSTDPFTLGVLLASWFIALWHTVARYETWSLSWALLSLDTVSSALILVLAGRPLPPLIDVLMLTITTALAGLLALLSARIFNVKASTDVRDIKELIG